MADYPMYDRQHGLLDLGKMEKIAVLGMDAHHVMAQKGQQTQKPK